MTDLLVASVEPGPDPGLGFQETVISTFKGVPSSLGSGPACSIRRAGACGRLSSAITPQSLYVNVETILAPFDSRWAQHRIHLDADGRLIRRWTFVFWWRYCIKTDNKEPRFSLIELDTTNSDIKTSDARKITKFWMIQIAIQRHFLLRAQHGEPSTLSLTAWTKLNPELCDITPHPTPITLNPEPLSLNPKP